MPQKFDHPHLKLFSSNVEIQKISREYPGPRFKVNGVELKSKAIGDGSVKAEEGAQGRAGKGRGKQGIGPCPQNSSTPLLKLLVAPLGICDTSSLLMELSTVTHLVPCDICN